MEKVDGQYFSSFFLKKGQKWKKNFWDLATFNHHIFVLVWNVSPNITAGWEYFLTNCTLNTRCIQLFSIMNWINMCFHGVFGCKGCFTNWTFERFFLARSVITIGICIISSNCTKWTITIFFIFVKFFSVCTCNIKIYACIGICLENCFDLCNVNK